MPLDGAVPSRPVLHDVAASQVRQARVPGGTRFSRMKGSGPPAHRIRAAVLRFATIVVADLELRRFAAVSRVDARRHKGVGGPHHETKAPSRVIGEHIGEYALTAEAGDPIVDRKVTRDPTRVTVAFALAPLHQAPIRRVPPQEDA